MPDLLVTTAAAGVANRNRPPACSSTTVGLRIAPKIACGDTTIDRLVHEVRCHPVSLIPGFATAVPSFPNDCPMRAGLDLAAPERLPAAPPAIIVSAALVPPKAGLARGWRGHVSQPRFSAEQVRRGRSLDVGIRLRIRRELNVLDKISEPLANALKEPRSTLGLLLTQPRSRRTPGAFPGAIHSLPPELPVTPLDPEVKIPDASFRPQRPRPGRGSAFSRGAAGG